MVVIKMMVMNKHVRTYQFEKVIQILVENLIFSYYNKKC